MRQLSFNFDDFSPSSGTNDSQALGPSQTNSDPLSKNLTVASTPVLKAPPNDSAASARKPAKAAIRPKAQKPDEAVDVTPPPQKATSVVAVAQCWTGELPSFADALAFVDAAPGLKPTKRRDYRSALLSAAKVLGQQPRDIRLDLKALSNTALTKVPKLRDRQVKRRRNILSGLNKVAALMGMTQPHRPGPDELRPDWLALQHRLEVKYQRYIIARFARYCSDRGISPAAVDTSVFTMFGEYLTANTIKSKRTDYLRRIGNIWCHLVKRYPDMGLQLITVPDQKAGLTLPYQLFPASFKEELDQLTAAMSPDDLGAAHDDLELSPEQRPYRPSRPMKHSTVALRTDQLRYAASALVHAGHNPKEIARLADLFTPISRVKTIIRHLRDRGAKQRSSYVFGVIEALRHAARFCHADEATQAELTRLKGLVAPIGDGVVPKNRERLRAMIEPNTRAIIMALPQLLVEDAEKCSDLFDAARLVRVAVAIELLTVVAPRMDNLNLLHLERSLRRATNGKCRISHMIVDETDVKNGVPIERLLPADTVDLVELWLTKYRQKLAEPGNPWLFPGEGKKPLSKSHLRKWITRAIRDYAKVEVHPHLFRHFCAWLHLQYHPGDYEGVRRLLGHKRLETSIKSYIIFEQDIAAARHDEDVLKERQVAKRVARQMLDGVRPGKAIKRPKKGATRAKKS